MSKPATPSQDFKFGMTDAELAAAKTIYAPDLLNGKTVLVSGGGSGLGKASAWLAGRLSATVIITGRTAEKLEKACAAMQADGIDAHWRTLNIREAEGIAEVFQELWTTFGKIDVLINSAGGQFPVDSLDLSPNGWKAVVDTNLNGTWFMMQAAARQWRDNGHAGNIINLVTVINRGMPNMAHTCAARAGVIYASKSLAIEWAPLNIRINCVAPGIIATEGMKVYPDEARVKFTNSNAMRRFASAWEIAESCLYLASEASGFVTGEVLTIDGGGHLWGDLWPLGKPEYFNEA